MTNQSIHNLNQCEIERFIKNPLPPPIEFTDRTQNGDFGLLPVELWNHIYDIKHSMEKNDPNLIIQKKDNIRVAEINISMLRLDYLNDNRHLFSFKNLREQYHREGVWEGLIEKVEDVVDGLAPQDHGYDEVDCYQYVMKILTQKRPRKNKIQEIDIHFNQVFEEFYNDFITHRGEKLYGYRINYIEDYFITRMVNLWKNHNNFPLIEKHSGDKKYMELMDIIEDNKDCLDIAAEFIKRSNNPIFQESFRSGVY